MAISVCIFEMLVRTHRTSKATAGRKLCTFTEACHVLSLCDWKQLISISFTMCLLVSLHAQLHFATLCWSTRTKFEFRTRMNLLVCTRNETTATACKVSQPPAQGELWRIRQPQIKVCMRRRSSSIYGKTFRKELYPKIVKIALQERGSIDSLSHYNLVHKCISMPQAMKIQMPQPRWPKNGKKLGNLPAWQMTKVKSRTEAIQEAQKEQGTVHFGALMHECGVGTEISEIQRLGCALW